MNDEPKIRVLIEVTLVSPDGFYTISKFTPELWEQKREIALRIAHKDHTMARENEKDGLVSGEWREERW